jgi:prevent-host-death family protein
MTVNVSIRDAQAHFWEMFKHVLEGEEVVISDNGHEIARLIPSRKQLQPRIPGIDKGRLVVPDDFNDPLPEDIQKAFEG